MIAISDLTAAARAYLRASRILSRQAHAEYDAAAYLGGYAVEIALKARICRTLGWAGYPQTNGEFRDYQSFKTHNLEALLHLSGRETRVKADPALLTDWSVVREWNPEQRYDPVGTKTATAAREMTDATGRLLGGFL